MICYIVSLQCSSMLFRRAFSMREWNCSAPLSAGASQPASEHAGASEPCQLKLAGQMLSNINYCRRNCHTQCNRTERIGNLCLQLTQSNHTFDIHVYSFHHLKWHSQAQPYVPRFAASQDWNLAHNSFLPHRHSFYPSLIKFINPISGRSRPLLFSPQSIGLLRGT